MNYILYSSILLLPFFSCTTNKKKITANSQSVPKCDVLPRIGDVDTACSVSKGNYILTSTNRMSRTYQRRVNDIDYIYCKSDKGIIDFIATSDSTFKTPEGYSRTSKPGTDIKGSSISTTVGWATYIKLPSGWNAVFKEGIDATADTGISDTARVLWFFTKQTQR